MKNSAPDRGWASRITRTDFATWLSGFPCDPAFSAQSCLSFRRAVDLHPSAPGRPMRNTTRLVTYGLLLVWSFVCLLPLYWLTIASFKSPMDQFDGPSYLPFYDFQPTLGAWYFILADRYENLRWAFFNSLVTALFATFVTMLLAGLAVYGVTRFPDRGSRLLAMGDRLMFWIIVTRVLPPSLLVLPLYFMAQKTGTLDTVLALTIAYTAVNLSVAIWLLRPVLGGKATEMEESALLEGASHLRILFEILLPVSVRGLAAAGLIIFVLCWNEYLIAAYLATNHAMTLPPWAVGQLSMKEAQAGGEAEEWAHMSAATVFMMVPVLLAAGYVQRFLGKLSFWRGD
jgi:multiple sugar transport system permease protein